MHRVAELRPETRLTVLERCDALRRPERFELITLPEIVALLEEGATLTECTERAAVCERSPTCPTRLIWQEAAKAMFDKLNTITLADLLPKGQAPAGAAQELRHVL